MHLTVKLSHEQIDALHKFFSKVNRDNADTQSLTISAMPMEWYQEVNIETVAELRKLLESSDQ